MAKYLKNVEEARSIILKGEGKIILKFKLNKRFFSKHEDYAEILALVKNIIGAMMSAKDVDYNHNQGIQMKDDYMIMNDKNLFYHLSKKSVEINFDLQKLHSEILKAVLDGVVLGLQMKQELNFKELKISTIFKKGWW